MNVSDQILLPDTFELVKEWHAICREISEGEFKRCRFAFKVREKCTDDHHFMEWCKVYLRGDDDEALMMRTYAVAGSVFKDAATLTSKRLTPTCARSLSLMTPHEQEALMRRSLNEDRSLIALVAAASHVNGTDPDKQTHPAIDARKLAEFVVRAVAVIPSTIGDIVARYVKAKDIKAAKQLTDGKLPPDTRRSGGAPALHEMRPALPKLTGPAQKAAAMRSALEELIAVRDRYQGLPGFETISLAIGKFAKEVSDFERKHVKRAA